MENEPITPGENLEEPKTPASDPAGTGEGTTAPAANNPDPSKPSTEEPAAGEQPKPDDPKAVETPVKLDSDLDKWAEKRGFPPAATDEQKLAYQQMRNEQRDFTRSRQQQTGAADLAKVSRETKDKLKPADGEEDDPLEQRLNALEEERKTERNMRLSQEVYATEQVTTEEHDAVKTILMEKIDRAATNEEKIRALEYWGDPAQLKDLVDLARARLSSGKDNSAEIEAAAQKEREKIAKESQARSPGRSATTTPVSPERTTDDRTASLLERYSTKK